MSRPVDANNSKLTCRVAELAVLGRTMCRALIMSIRQSTQNIGFICDFVCISYLLANFFVE